MFRSTSVSVSMAITIASLLSSCALPPTHVDEYEAQPYSANESIQKKDGIRVEMVGSPQIVTNGNPLPEVFVQTAIKCDMNGRPMEGSGTTTSGNTLVMPLFQHNAPTETVRLLQPGEWVQKITITNNTRHILRFNNVVVRLFDPSGNQADPIGHDEMRAGLLAARPCPTSNQVAASIDRIPLLNKNVEIVPNTSYTGYLVFGPQSPTSGVWKVALYEVPIATNSAGEVTKTTQFEIRSVLKHYVATYTHEFGKPPALSERHEAM